MVNPTLSQGVTLFIYYHIQFDKILLRIFVSMRMKAISLSFYFLATSLSGFVQGNADRINGLKAAEYEAGCMASAC